MHDQKLPLYPHYVMKEHAALFSVAVRQCGSWDKALSAAGISQVQAEIPWISYDGLRRQWTLERRSRKRWAPRSIINGSLARAKRALKTAKRFLSRWTKQKIIRLIAQRLRSGETLTDATASREFSPLFTAAEVRRDKLTLEELIVSTSR